MPLKPKPGNNGCQKVDGLETLWSIGLETAARAIEFVAAIILVVGAVRFVVIVLQGIVSASTDSEGSIFRHARVSLGGYILSALEFLIVADILFTILRRTLEELYILAILTAIRTTLSWFLTRELKELESDSASRSSAGKVASS